jgi:hypothetical protein
MVTAIPAHICVTLARVNLDIVEERRRLGADIESAGGNERAALIETDAQLLALENAIGVVLGAQGELESSPGVVK